MGFLSPGFLDKVTQRLNLPHSLARSPRLGGYGPEGLVLQRVGENAQGVTFQWRPSI